jgi:hypothetical protein
MMTLAASPQAVNARPTARVVPPFDPDFYRSQNAVAEGRALWLAHRHLHASDPLPSANPARDIVLLDDDGTPLETPREMAARHRAERMAQLRALLEGNPFLANAPATGRARYPGLRAFAEAAVREGRAEWLPMSSV